MLLNHKSLYVVENIRDIHSRKSYFYLNKFNLKDKYYLRFFEMTAKKKQKKIKGVGDWLNPFINQPHCNKLTNKG